MNASGFQSLLQGFFTDRLQGEFGASANSQLAVELIIGVTTHFIWQQMLNDKTILSDELAEQIIELLFKGLNE